MEPPVAGGQINGLDALASTVTNLLDEKVASGVEYSGDIRYEKDYAAFYKFNEGVYDGNALPTPFAAKLNQVLQPNAAAKYAAFPPFSTGSAGIEILDHPGSSLGEHLSLAPVGPLEGAAEAFADSKDNEWGKGSADPVRPPAPDAEEAGVQYNYSHDPAYNRPQQSWPGYPQPYAEGYSRQQQQQQQQQQPPTGAAPPPQQPMYRHHPTGPNPMQQPGLREMDHMAGYKPAGAQMYRSYNDPPQSGGYNAPPNLQYPRQDQMPYNPNYGPGARPFMPQPPMGIGGNYYDPSNAFELAEQQFHPSRHQFQRRGRQNFRTANDRRGGWSDGICKYFRQGKCRHGSRCKYRHELGGVRRQDFAARMREPRVNTPQISFPAIVDAEYITNKVIMLSKDQNGCRILQKKMDEGEEEVVDIILSESEPYLTQMMVEPFGNYLFQKFLENVTEEWKTRILDKVADNLVVASLSIHGTRSVQKIVEHCVQDDHVDRLVATLEPSVVDLSKNSNGNHVVQKCLKHPSLKARLFVIRVVTENTRTISTHRHGCCVVQRCLDATTPETPDTAADRAKLVAKIIENAMTLMQNAYGNYVIQYLVEHGTDADASQVMQAVVGFTAQLSQQKYSSNVVEKCLVKATPDIRARMLLEISEPAVMQVLLFHRFANYVVQRALKVATPAERALLVAAIAPHAPGLMHNAGGRRILDLCRNDLAQLEIMGTPLVERPLLTTEDPLIQLQAPNLDVEP